MMAAMIAADADADSVFSTTADDEVTSTAAVFTFADEAVHPPVSAGSAVALAESVFAATADVEVASTSAASSLADEAAHPAGLAGGAGASAGPWSFSPHN